MKKDKENSYEEKKQDYSSQLYEMATEHNWHEISGFADLIMDEFFEMGKRQGLLLAKEIVNSDRWRMFIKDAKVRKQMREEISEAIEKQLQGGE